MSPEQIAANIKLATSSGSGLDQLSKNLQASYARQAQQREGEEELERARKEMKEWTDQGINPETGEKLTKEEAKELGVEYQGGVWNTVKEFGKGLVDAEKEHKTKEGQGHAEAFAEILGKNRESDEARESLIESTRESAQSLRKAAQDKDRFSSGKRKELLESAEEMEREAEGYSSEYQDKLAARADAVDPKKQIARMGMTTLDVTGFGTLSRAAKVGKGMVAANKATKAAASEAVSKGAKVRESLRAGAGNTAEGLRKVSSVINDGKIGSAINKGADPFVKAMDKVPGLVRTAGVGAGFGASYGALDPIAREGGEVTLGDVWDGTWKGAAIGGVAGPILHGGMKLGGHGFNALGGRTNKGMAYRNALRSVQNTDIDAETLGKMNNLVKESKNATEFNREWKKLYSDWKMSGGGKKLETPKESRPKSTEEIDAEMDALAMGEDPAVYRTISKDGEDISEVASRYDQEIGEVEGNISRAEERSQMGEGAHREVSGGKATLNIGLGDNVQPKAIRTALKEIAPDVKVSGAKTVKGEGSSTYVPKLSRDLSPEEMTKLSEALEGSTVAGHSGKEGSIVDTRGGEDFNTDKYINQEGKSFTELAEGTKGNEMRVKARNEAEELAGQRDALVAERDAALEGSTRELDQSAAQARRRELVEERRRAQAYSDAANMSPEKQAELKKEYDDLDAGNVSDEYLLEPIEVKDAESAAEAMQNIDPTDSMGYQRGAVEIREERARLNGKRDELYHQDQYDKDLDGMRKNYDKDLKELEGLPESVRAKKMEEIEARYAEESDIMDQRLAEDADAVANLDEHLRQQKELEDALVADVNIRQGENPDLMRAVNEDAVADRMSDIEDLLYQYENGTVIDAQSIINKNVEMGKSTSDLSEVNPGVDKAATQVRRNDQFSLQSNTGKDPAFRKFMSLGRNVLDSFGESGRTFRLAAEDANDLLARMQGDWTIIKKRHEKTLRKGREGASKDIVHALDGDAEAMSRLSSAELEVYTDYRDMLNKRADELGLPEGARIKDYFPHVFDNKDVGDVQTAINKLIQDEKGEVILKGDERKRLQDLVSGFSPDSLARMTDQARYMGKDGFLKKRKGAGDWSEDLDFVMDLYMEQSAKSISYKPLEALHGEMKHVLTDKQNKYVETMVENLQGKTDTLLESFLDTQLQNLGWGSKGSTERVLGQARNLVYTATLGGNVGSAVRNLQSAVNTYAELGTKHMGRAIPDAWEGLFSKDSVQMQELYRAGVMSGTQEQWIRGRAPSDLAKNKTMKAMWGMFNTTEQLNRATAYFGGKNKYLAKNPGDFKGAERAGAEMARKTQFKFSALDTPQGFQGAVGKSLFQLQSWNLQELEFMTGLAKGAFKSPENFMKATRFVGANMAFFGAVGAATGMNWREAIPFFSEAEDTIKNGRPTLPRSPIVQLVIGDGRANPGILGGVADSVKGIASGEGADALKGLDASMRNSFRTFVPGGNQLLKTAEGIASNVQGASLTGSGLTDTAKKAGSILTGDYPGGNIRFLQDESPWEQLKAGVFGQYATSAGMDWVKGGMNSLPANMKIGGMEASKYIMGLPREAQEKYVDYYQHKSQASDAVKKEFGESPSQYRNSLVKQLRDGELNYPQFIKRADDYNRFTGEMMQGWNHGGDPPARLLDDMLKTLYMDVKSPGEYDNSRSELTRLQQENMYRMDDRS